MAPTSVSYDTSTLPVILDSIPDELKTRRQWVNWRWELRGDKITKPPVRPGVPPRYAATTKAATWATFEACEASLRHHAGLGFVFSPDDPYAGVDLDNCRDKDTGRIDEWARRWIELFATYAEVSPSETGVKLFCRAAVAGHKGHKVEVRDSRGAVVGAVEWYDCGRYFTVTGRALPGCPSVVVDCSSAMAALESAYATAEATPAAPRSVMPVSMDDAELLERARMAKNGPLFAALYDRGAAAAGYDDDSRADLALCNLLAYWCGRDAARMDSLFRRSALIRDKWERNDYRSRTMGLAIQGCREVYTGPTARERERVHKVNGAQPVEEQAGKATQVNSSVVKIVPSLANHTFKAPERLAEEAFYGLPGEVVKTLSPHTESADAAILVTFLVAAGCMLGPTLYVYRDGARHHANEFACLVGPTANARKGTAYLRVAEILNSLPSCYNSNYTNNSTHDMKDSHARESGTPNLFPKVQNANDGTILTTKGQANEPALTALEMSGLGSGEALIEALSDPNEDRRRLVYEAEFSKPLKVGRREGSTLSETIRAAWDGGTLANRTKGKQLKAVGTHICMLGHITAAELQQQMGGVDKDNGFANRFLWICAVRSKELPFGGGEAPIAPLVARLQQTLEYQSVSERIEFDKEASLLWDQGGIYHMLTNRPPGALGAVTNRADAHVTRLALLYAALDLERVIRPVHLLAALAVWDYNEESCRYLFGQSSGDRYEDLILELLMENFPNNLTRVEIRDAFGRNADAGRIPAALAALHAKGLAVVTKSAVTYGRPPEHWSYNPEGAAQREESESPLHRARALMKERGL